MTLIIGILYKGTVQIIADSAETIPSSTSIGLNINDDYYELSNSSFGNLIEDVDGEKVIESSQKIYQITNNIIAAFSGSTIKGKQIIQDIEIRLLSSLDNDFIKILKNYFKEIEIVKNEFVFGVSNGSSVKMITYSKGIFDISSAQEGFTMIGSGIDQQYLRNYLFKTLMDLSNEGLNSKEFLICVTAFFQCLILNSNSYVKGVGGFVNSALLHKEGVYWIDDTIKILYSSKNFKEGDMIIHSQYTRDQITLVSSSYISSSVYFNSGFKFSVNYLDWKNRWLDEIIGFKNNLNAEYYFLISYDNLRVIIIENSTNQKMKYIIANLEKGYDDSNKYNIGCHPDLINLMTEDSESKDVFINLL